MRGHALDARQGASRDSSGIGSNCTKSDQGTASMTMQVSQLALCCAKEEKRQRLQHRGGVDPSELRECSDDFGSARGADVIQSVVGAHDSDAGKAMRNCGSHQCGGRGCKPTSNWWSAGHTLEERSRGSGLPARRTPRERSVLGGPCAHKSRGSYRLAAAQESQGQRRRGARRVRR